MEKLALACLRAFGWKVNGFRPPEEKYILIVAPHTSVMDFVIGRLAFWTKRLPARFFIKKEFFVFPIRRLLKALGGMPIDRRQAGNVVEHSANLLKEADELALIITPEGTRKATSQWKKGFYYIAKRAHVPVYAGIVDYGRKTCKRLPQPLDRANSSDDLMRDWAKTSHRTKARHPENIRVPASAKNK